MKHADAIPDASPAPRPADDGRAHLVRFVADRDDAAFAELVARFGPMVFGVCRRVLCDRHDAEDAFQATFLVLARDAGTVLGKNRPVGVWLYGIAYRMATHARRAAARRKRRELRQDTPMPPADPTLEIAHRDLCEALDRELHALPDRLREPLVLCYLGEQTHDEAARQLGLHPRSVERRIQSGLSELQRRLGRRGVALSAAALVLILSQQATAKVPAALAATTAKAAVGAGAASGGAAALVAGTAIGWAAWAAGGAAVVVAAGLVIGLNPAPQVIREGSVSAPVAAVPAAPDPNAKPFLARGRVVDANNQPAAGATVLLISRPVRRVPGSLVEAIPDPLSTQKFRTGIFRELARGKTDADGRFVLSGELVIPDPTTGAVWFQSLPAVVKEPGKTLRVEDSEGEFGNMIWLPGVGIP